MRATSDDGDEPAIAPSLAEIVGLLRELELALSAGLSVTLSEEHTTVDQWRVLEAIARLEYPTMGEIAAETGMPNASLSRIVDGLEDAAHAYRLPDAADRRRITVRLTDRGQSLLSRVTTIVTDWERATARRLGASTVAALRDGVVAGVTAIGLRQDQIPAS
ncbi:DNA-binding MarR family transcriptional regulator [Marisediminicola sp. UYEF4]|uniref:MarR family winged helix-turn-helix transcriptional regulator n=1 Tax=Marisediminicola sp. UYEF4 TaxID=1756384 RepID=UPI00339107AA